MTTEPLHFPPATHNNNATYLQVISIDVSAEEVIFVLGIQDDSAVGVLRETYRSGHRAKGKDSQKHLRWAKLTISK